ncbi:PTS sugar transporter subunit IIA [Paenibacillus massiliensis]|uniref:PTS sugar transporter subunit IIA n=1 Tax=Paenibacillus massiliensis TaxID=225917 RepID=UPI000405380C|nr:PTS glucose transporter subunit IIA [Paenibacillus massiliensis]
MFQWLKGKKKLEQLEVMSPITGKLLSLKKVPDPAFAQGHMGQGVGIEPTEGKVYAPFDGRVAHLMEKSKHAVIVEHESGAQVLIHVGVDTVALKGNGFTAHVQSGDPITAGQLLLEFDIQEIQAAGYSVVSPVIVPDGLDSVESVDTGQVELDSKVTAKTGGIFTVHLR